MAFTTTRSAVLALLGFLLAAPLESTPSWTFTGEASSVGLGHALAGLGDVNGDGFDDIAVGTLDIGEDPGLGRTLVFLGSPAGLSPTPRWTFLEGGTPSTAFDVNGDGFDDLFVRSRESKAYLFLGSPYGLLSPPATTIHPALVVFKIVGLGDTTGDGFGDAVLIHAPPTGTQLHFFKGSADGIGFASPVIGIGDVTDIAAAGDVNGDGRTDLMITTMTNLDDGRVAVHHGSPNFFNGTEHWSSTGDGQGGFGTRVAGAGDVDGDGFDDVLVTAPHFTSASGEEGKVYLFRGSDSGLGLTPAWTFVSGNLLVGARIASAGDVNGDGFSDVAISPGADAVFLFLGSSAGLSSTPDQVLTGAGATTFGWALDSAGDVDGDGKAELLVGDPFFGSDAGRASLFRSPSSAVAFEGGVASRGERGGCGALGAEAWLIPAVAWLLRRRSTRRAGAVS